MKKIFMPKDVFEFGCTAALYLHFASGKDYIDIIEGVWEGYRANTIDDGVVDDMKKACSFAIDIASHDKKIAEIDVFFYCLAYYIKEFNADETRKRKKFLNGLFFQKSIEDKERVRNFIRRVAIYYAKFTNNVAPIPPKGYNPFK